MVNSQTPRRGLETAVDTGLPRSPTAGETHGRPRFADVVELFLPPFLVFWAVIGFWLFLTYGVMDPNQRFLLPPPHEVVQEGLLTQRWLTEILAGLWSTTQVTLFGLVLAIIIGMTLAVIMAQARWLERSIFPYAVVVQALPIVAIVPIIGLWFGFGFNSRVLVVIIIAIFPIITNTLFGLRSVDPAHHDLFTLHGVGRFTRLWKLQFPSATPALFTGLRIAAGLAVIGAIVGDFFFRQGEPGIGRLLDIYQRGLRAEQLIVAILFSSLLGLALFTLFGFMGNRLTRAWHPSATTIWEKVKSSRRGPGKRDRSAGTDTPSSAAPTPQDASTVRAGGAEQPGIGLAHSPDMDPQPLTTLAAKPEESAGSLPPRVTTDEAPRSQAAKRKPLRLVGPPLATAALVAAAWYLVSYVVLQPERRFLVPPVHELWTKGFGDPANRAQLLDGLWTTSKVAIAGLVIAITIGVLVAVLMSQAKWMERSLYPWAVVLQTIPILALVPLIGLWFGFGFTGRVIVCVLIALFPIITNTLFGLQSAEDELHDLFTLHDAGRAARFRKLELRAAVPAMFTGFRIAAGLVVIGAIVGEFFFQRGERGLGNLLALYRGRLQTPEMFAALLLSSLLGIAVFWLFGRLGFVFTRDWHESEHTSS